MQGLLRVGKPEHRGRLRLRPGDVLGPRPRPVAVLDGDVVLVGTFTKKLLQRVGHRRLPGMDEQI